MFQFNCVEDRDVKKSLKSLPDNGSTGPDNFDSKVLNIAADSGP